MQAVSCIVHPFIPSKSATKETPLTFTTCSPLKRTISFSTSRGSLIKANSVAQEPFMAFNYNSQFSVFPAEACETIGGETCAANMYPEIKLNQPQGSNSNTNTSPQEVDREYFDYNIENRSVLRAEACDDLGGEFCDGPFM